MEAPPKQFFRLAPGREVRLRYAYFIKCESVVKDPGTGEINALHCTYDPATRGGDSPDGRKVKATLHWVSSEHSISATVRLYDSLFVNANPNDIGEGEDFIKYLNPKSLTIIDSRVEPSLSEALSGSHYQFERMGYFSVDPVDSVPGKPVFNRIVTLKDEWAKIQKTAKK
jgi:glutaminyl-tRNA synthetase